MGAFAGIAGIISLIIGIALFIAILNIADNTKQTNKLLRLLLNEQNPERFELKGNKLKDNQRNKKI